MRAVVGTAPNRRAPAAFAAWAVAVLLFVACLAMWLVIPPMWLWLLSRLGGSSASYVLVLVGLPVSLALWGLMLVRLDALHERAATSVAHPDEQASLLTACLTVSLVLALIVGIAAALLGLLPSTGHSFGPFPD